MQKRPPTGRAAKGFGQNAAPGKPFGKTAPAAKPFGRPAAIGKPFGRPASTNNRPGKADSTAKPLGKPMPGGKLFGRSAPAHGSFGRPASGSGAVGADRAPGALGKPVPGGKPTANGKPFGRPVPTGGALGKPAPANGASGGTGSVRVTEPFRKPNAVGKPSPGGKPFGRPAPTGKPVRPAAPFAKHAQSERAKPFSGPARPPRVPDNPRLIALHTLQDVSQQDAYASLALSERLTAARLDPRDRDLVTELVYGTLERRLTLDYLLDTLLDRPDTEPLIRDLLRLGAYQILYLDRVPDSAAVDESVKLARALNREPFTGLINATLRNLIRRRDALPLPAREEDVARHISVAHSLPEWIVTRLIEAYGAETAEQIAAFRPTEHPLIVRRIAARIDRESFEALMTEKEWAWTAAKVDGAYYVRHATQIGLDKAFLQGFYAVQGEGSILAARAVSPRRADSVLDACAAPGGKTACLSEMMQGTGRVYAWDVHEHRVELIRGMTNRLRLDNVRPAVRDARVFRDDLEYTMDAVLIDAPCSGLGVLLEKPDVRYRRKPEDIPALCETQAALLNVCSRYVKVGGTLVYATCTILPEENGGQIDAFLAAHRDFAPDPEGLAAALPAFAHLAENGRIQFLPHRDGIEGFFIARLKRLPRA